MTNANRIVHLWPIIDLVRSTSVEPIATEAFCVALVAATLLEGHIDDQNCEHACDLSLRITRI
jgi:hypothetical protein